MIILRCFHVNRIQEKNNDHINRFMIIEIVFVIIEKKVTITQFYREKKLKMTVYNKQKWIELKRHADAKMTILEMFRNHLLLTRHKRTVKRNSDKDVRIFCLYKRKNWRLSFYYLCVCVCVQMCGSLIFFFYLQVASRGALLGSRAVYNLLIGAGPVGVSLEFIHSSNTNL